MTIQSNIRIPFQAVEIDNTGAQQGPALLAYRAGLIGQKLPSGSWAANSLNRATSAAQVAAGAGRGSMLHNMAEAWFSINQFTECWILVLADNSAGVAASGSLAFSGTATAAGTVSLYIGGRLVEVAVAVGDTATTIATNVTTAIGKRATGTVTFTSAGAGDNVTVSGTLEDGTAVSVQFVGTSGAVTPGAATYSIDTSDTAAAASLAAQIKAHALVSRLVTAEGSSTVCTITAIAPGTGGNSIGLAVTDAVATAVSAANLAGGLGDASSYPVSASSSSGTVTVTSRHKGAVMNEYDLRVNYQDGEALPTGVSLVVTGMASGTSNPVLTSLIAAMGDQWFHVLAHPYTDATSLTALETELASRFEPMRQIPGQAYTYKSDTHGALSTLGESRNSKHSTIVPSNATPTPTFECAAHLAAVISPELAADPALPLQTLALPWIKAPAEASRYTNSERNLHLYDGISSTKVGPGNVVQVDRLITTYQLNAVGADDSSYMDVNTMHNLMYLRYSWRTFVQLNYPRAKLAADGVRIGPGQNVLTPKIGRAGALMWFAQMESLGLVEGAEQFKRDVQCNRSDTDPNRLEWIMPLDLMNAFVVGDTSIKFKL